MDMGGLKDGTPEGHFIGWDEGRRGSNPPIPVRIWNLGRYALETGQQHTTGEEEENLP